MRRLLVLRLGLVLRLVLGVRLVFLGLLVRGVWLWRLLVLVLLLAAPVVRPRGVSAQGKPLPPLAELAVLRRLFRGGLLWVLRCAGGNHVDGYDFWWLLHTGVSGFHSALYTGLFAG